MGKASEHGPSLAVLCVLLVPAAAHAVGLAVTIRYTGPFLFTYFDLSILAVIFVYLGVVAYAVNRRSLALRVSVAVYATLLSLALGEVFFRFLEPKSVPLQQKPAGTLVLHAADGLPGVEGEIRITTNELGVRGPIGIAGQADVRILCIGGSSVECGAVTDSRSWPWALQDRLAAQTGKRVYVGNAGRSGQFAWHHQHLIENHPHLALYDWIVIQCGVNDMAAMLRRNHAERVARARESSQAFRKTSAVYYKQLRLYQKIMAIRRFLRQTWGERYAVQDLAGHWLHDARVARQEAKGRGIVDVPPARYSEGLKQYRRDLVKLIKCCRVRNKRVVFLTQAALWQQGLSSEKEALCWGGIDAESGKAYSVGILAKMLEGYNQVMREVCQQAGVDCIDLSRMLPHDEHVFYDDVHYNAEGCSQIAQILTAYFVRRLHR